MNTEALNLSHGPHVRDRWTTRFIMHIVALALLPAIFFLERQRDGRFFLSDATARKRMWIGGALCGLLLCLAVNLQQFGIGLYPADTAISGRVGFITTLYVILVPLFGIVLGRRFGPFLWVGIALAMVGTGLLCFSGGVDQLYLGDLPAFGCAAAFALQIMCVEHYVKEVDALRLSAVQFFVCGCVSALLAVIFEPQTGSAAWFSGVREALLPLLYLGVASCGVGYTCQTIGQRYADAPMASMTMSLESVFSAVFGALLLGERMTGLQALGGALMFSALIVANLPDLLVHLKNKKTKEGDMHDDTEQ